MRLTLRTLLAWLDDKLPPSEVREIGKQVSESPYANELVERINRVTRQRRLMVPPASGPDAVDPNVVAAYIDNELDGDRVAEFEKKCLTSDVHLAEVSSTHQILSLVGQKAKVPAEARLRMYGLIKGRESIRPTREEVVRASEPGSEPDGVQTWVIPSAPRRPWLERFGPAAAVIGLILVLTLSAWKTLTPTDDARTFPAAIARADSPDGPEAARRLIDGEPVIPATPAPEPEPAAEAAEAPAPAAPPAEAPPPAPGAAEPAAPKAPAKPAGSIGLAQKLEGVLLRYRPEERDWERLTEASTLKDGDRILSVAPYRSKLEIGAATVDLVGEAEVTIKVTPEALAARFELNQGRVSLHGTSPSLPFEVQFGDTSVTVLPPPGSSVGLERVGIREMGAPAPKAPSLRIHASAAPVTVTPAGGTAKSIEEPGSMLIGGELAEPLVVVRPAPPWLAEEKLSPFDQAVGQQFLEFFRADRPIVSGLVEASENEQEDVCRVAIEALMAVGDISYIIPLLNKQGDPAASTARNAAIAALRGYLAEGPEQAALLAEQLRREFGDEVGALTEKLLVGFGPKEAEENATFARLVDLLAPGPESTVATRELALNNLRALTRQGDLGYDPEKPTDAGLKPWRDLLREEKLRPVPPAPAAP